jgi:hypothetical protein
LSQCKGAVECSDGKVRFGSVRQRILPNLEPDRQFSSGVLLELEPEPMVLVQKSSVPVQGGWNREPNLFIARMFFLRDLLELEPEPSVLVQKRSVLVQKCSVLVRGWWNREPNHFIAFIEKNGYNNSSYMRTHIEPSLARSTVL